MAVVVVAFGTLAVIDVVAFVLGVEPGGLNAHVFVLLPAYSLFRWGAGREAGVGLAVMLAAYALNIVVISSEVAGVGEAIAALAFLLLPAALGASVRWHQYVSIASGFVKNAHGGIEITLTGCISIQLKS